MGTGGPVCGRGPGGPSIDWREMRAISNDALDGDVDREARWFYLSGDGPWRERLWRQKPTPLDTFVRIEEDSAS